MKEMTGWIAVDRRTDEGFGINCIHGRSAAARTDVTRLMGLEWEACYRLGWRIVRVVIREAVAGPAQPAEAPR